MVQHFALHSALSREVHASGQPPHRVLSGGEYHGQEHMIEVGVPTTVMIENRDVVTAVDVAAVILIGLSLGSWHGSLS
jgi:hypothetical protein